MQDEDKNLQTIKKRALLKALGLIVYENRNTIQKGINKFSYEYDIGNGLLSRMEKGTVDTKITTLWKLANAFGYKCSDFVKLIEDKLPSNFNFYE